MSFDRMVAITGGIGSGKSYISKKFEEMGVPVFNTDDCAKCVMNKDQWVVSNLKAIFGEEIYVNGEIDKKVFGDIIFNDKKSLEMVEALVHPAVLREFLDWKFKKIYIENFPFVMMESAILTKHKTHKLFDYVVLVTAPIELRKERILRREGMTVEKMEMVMEKQDSPETIYGKLSGVNAKIFSVCNNEQIDLNVQIENCLKELNYKFKN